MGEAVMGWWWRVYGYRGVLLRDGEIGLHYGRLHIVLLHTGYCFSDAWRWTGYQQGGHWEIDQLGVSESDSL